MGDIDNERIGREARDAVGTRRLTTGENPVQLAMRRYLGAVAFRSRDKGHGESEKPEGKPSTRRLTTDVGTPALSGASTPRR